MNRKEEIKQASNEQLDNSRYYRVAFCEGAEWADKTMIDKVCNWIYQHNEAYLIRNQEGTWLDSNLFISDLKKAMKK